jgi:hypothetical protein
MLLKNFVFDIDQFVSAVGEGLRRRERGQLREFSNYP